MPTVTVTVTAAPTPSGAPDETSAEDTPTVSAEDSALAACPTSTTTMLAALYADGDSCTTVGERYTLAGADLSCTKDRNGATVWMEKSKADKLAADLAKEKTAPTNSGSGTDAQTTEVVPSVPQVGGTIICKDGSVWPGTVRRGACHGHHGIAN
jgi:hypothetical protein